MMVPAGSNVTFKRTWNSPSTLQFINSTQYPAHVPTEYFSRLVELVEESGQQIHPSTINVIFKGNKWHTALLSVAEDATAEDANSAYMLWRMSRP